MKRALLLLLPLLALGCLEPWALNGPYACSAEETCPDGFACDDGLCCRPGGAPACVTIPVDNKCADGSTPSTYYRDDDHDGYGNVNLTGRFCAQPLRTPWVTLDNDCDDNDPAVNPAATDGCDGKDNNCDGERDENLNRTQWYRDQDGDGFGDANDAVPACGQPAGYVDNSGDCAPDEVARHPGAAELCNNLDDNCNGQKDDAPVADVGDAFPCQTNRPGLCTEGRFECQLNSGTQAFERVCNSKRAPTVDVCDGLDNDCDGTADEQPSCGGPASLINTVGVTSGGQRFYPSVFADLSTRCNKDYAPSSRGPVGTQWANPNWTFSSASTALQEDFQVWWAEAPAGEYWDLTAANLTLHLQGQVGNIINGAAGVGGYWGEPGRYRTPVVFLCGVNQGEYTRYVPKTRGGATPTAADYAGSGILQYSETVLNTDIPVGGSSGSDWLIGGGSGFDLTRVKRVEVVLWPEAPTSGVATYTITFSQQAGFVK